MAELLAKLSKLPRHCVVYYLTLFADGAGTPSSPTMPQGASCGYPMRRCTWRWINTWASVQSAAASIVSHSLGEQAAELRDADAARGTRRRRSHRCRWLRTCTCSTGARCGAGNSMSASAGRQRGAVPARSTAWESYRAYIAGGMTLILFLSAMVVALLVNRAQRRRAEQARRESDERRRRAEEDVKRQRDELAHALRLTTLGELTASISHELNQPLTAIAANAQAAQQLLKSDREQSGCTTRRWKTWCRIRFALPRSSAGCRRCSARNAARMPRSI